MRSPRVVYAVASGGSAAALETAQLAQERRVLGQLAAAADVVATAIQQGDLRTALAVLKGIGVLAGSPPAIGSEDPAELAEEAEVTVRERTARRGLGAQPNEEAAELGSEASPDGAIPWS